MPGAVSDGKNSLMTTIIVVLLLSLMGAGIGFAVGVFLQPGKEVVDNSAPSPEVANAKPDAGVKVEEGTENGDTAEESSGEDDTVDANFKIFAIPPVVTTLAAPEGKWIRLEGSILAKPGGDKPPELLAEQAGEQILAYLRTVRLEQLQGPSGLLALRDDLNETVRSLSNDQVHAVLIHQLLIE